MDSIAAAAAIASMRSSASCAREVRRKQTAASSLTRLLATISALAGIWKKSLNTYSSSPAGSAVAISVKIDCTARSEEHTSELQSQFHLVCRLLLEKKKQ